jgi:hypothetical protein
MMVGMKNMDNTRFWAKQTKGNDEEEQQISPWRGISVETLPTELKNQLKPHWSNWLVANPELARNSGSRADIVIFANKRNRIEPVASLADIEIGQDVYVLRRRPHRSRKNRGGGHEKLPAFAHYTSEYQPEPPRNHPDSITIHTPCWHDHFYVGRSAELLGDGPYSLDVTGTVTASDTVQLSWRPVDEQGTSGQTPAQSVTNGIALPWQERIDGLTPGDYHLTARTARGNNTFIRFVIHPETCPVHEILYRPEDRTFFLLTEDDYQQLEQDAAHYDELITQLEQAHQSQDDEQLNAAKQQLDNELKPLVDTGGETSQLTEVIGFRGKKYTYVTSDKLKNHVRSYRIDKDIDKARIINDQGQFDYTKFKKQFAEKEVNIDYTWAEIDPNGGSLNQWASAINRKLDDLLSSSQPEDPKRRYDTSAAAQILRYSYGASAKNNFSLSNKTFGIKGEASADFALAEGKVGVNGYYPDAQGWALQFSYTVENGLYQGRVKQFDFGHIRAKAALELAGFAGASCQASGGMTFELDAGTVRPRGSTKDDEHFVGVGGEAFAGIKATGAVDGSLEWQNPENGLAWAALMTIGVEGSAAFGGGANAEFYIDYFEGKFTIRAQAKLIWGVGGGGGFAFTVGADTIVDFFLFIYHQLKNNDFNFVDVLSLRAFEYYDTVRSYLAFYEDTLEQVYEEGRKFLRDMKFSILDKLQVLEDAKQNQAKAEALAKRLLDNPDLVTFLTPEGKGRLLRNLCYSYWSSLEETQEDAMLAILRTVQTWNEYKEIMEHLSGDGRRILPNKGVGDQTWQRGEETLWDFLDGAQERKWRYERLHLFLNRQQQLPRQPQLHAAAIRDNGLTSIA